MYRAHSLFNKNQKKVGNFKIKKKKHSKVEQKEKFSWNFNLLIQTLRKKTPLCGSLVNE